ncbi:uncharacterized protein LOC129874939 [Solanum dulcamara]|uniref:uncharacterized protein LOC129874939 n=1 Tax=Solanum dulcamara TaxID=45834 RepID=UPI002485E154|nr:uncharacterized protein LOC129874939 [Solanum dulcamara]
MPFPWKKMKKTSISQLVKEHVNSQSGSPLMVETGFPTSIVDLVVKNRARFKKSSKKKLADDPFFLPSPSPSPPPPPSPETLPSTSHFMIDDNEVRPLIRVGEVEGDKSDSRRSCREQPWGNGGLSMNQGLMAVLKMSLVAALVLGMNNLVMGVTMSAFLLFLLEYIGERLYGFCSRLQRRVRLMIQGIRDIFRVKVVEDEDDCVFKAPLERKELSKDGCSDFGHQIQEIEVVRETYVEDREKIEECIWDEKSKCVRVDVMEKGEESRYDLCESKEKKSHRAKMKSKMKKLVLKKFRKKKGSALERPMLLDEIDYVIEGRKETKGSREQKMQSNSIVSSVASSTDDKTDIVEVVGSAGESSEVLTDGSVEESFNGTDEATIVQEEELTGREHSSMYIALVLVVLVGLIGGRVLALVFTLTCCLMLKRSEGIGRFTKLPVIRCFAKRFS